MRRAVDGKPLLGLAGYSGSGKTTLLCALLPQLQTFGIRSAVVKHAHHQFDIDFAGKDSFEVRKAGAGQVVVGSAGRRARIVETPGVSEVMLDDLLGELKMQDIDLVLVEGFRDARFPKIEVWRNAAGRPLLAPEDTSIIALVSDGSVSAPPGLPEFHSDETAAVARFVYDYCRRFNQIPGGLDDGRESTTTEGTTEGSELPG